MKLLFHKLTCISLIFVSNICFACMPLAPSSTLLGRLQSVEPNSQIQSYTVDKTGYMLRLFAPKFAFGSVFDRLGTEAPQQLEATFNPSNVKPQDMIIALVDTYDSAQSSSYRVYAIAPVTCHNDGIKLGRPIFAPDNPGWNPLTEQCGASQEAGILDGFVGEKSQADYLADLQAKYPTCETLDAAFMNNQPSQSSFNPNHKRFWQWFKGFFGS